MRNSVLIIFMNINNNIKMLTIILKYFWTIFWYLLQLNSEKVPGVKVLTILKKILLNEKLFLSNSVSMQSA